MPHSPSSLITALILVAWLQLNVRGWLWARTLAPRRRLRVRMRAVSGLVVAGAVLLVTTVPSVVTASHADLLVGGCCAVFVILTWRAHSCPLDLHIRPSSSGHTGG